jgi:hypothetical protein
MSQDLGELNTLKNFNRDYVNNVQGIPSVMLWLYYCFWDVLKIASIFANPKFWGFRGWADIG